MQKPTKPYPSFPLTPHATGWVKKIKGKVVWIAGHVSADEALAAWHEREASLVRAIPQAVNVSRGDRMTLGEVIGLYVEARHAETSAGQITAKHFCQLRDTLADLEDAAGSSTRWADLGPAHFSEFAAGLAGMAASGRRKARAMVVGMVEFVAEEGWVRSKPAFGAVFKRMGQGVAVASPREDLTILTRAEYRRCLAAVLWRLRRPYAKRRALQQFYAMLLLGMNGGYGAMEVAQLRGKNLRLDEAIIVGRRSKTGARHRVPLWPETVAALRVLGPVPAESRVFVTAAGRPYCYGAEVRDANGDLVRVADCDTVRLLWSRYCVPVLDVKRPGVGFYLLRHTHRSISGGAGDEMAADVLMGHDMPGMRKVYEHISVERLRAVAEHVRRVALRNPSGFERVERPAKR